MGRMRAVRLTRWMTLACAVVLLCGCGTSSSAGDYCAIAQRPFAWHGEDEVMATPVRVVRYIEEGAALWGRVCR